MRLLLVLALAVSAAVVGSLLYDRSGGGTAAYVAEHPVSVPETLRTVNLTATMPLPSAGERNLSAMVVEGELPDAPTTGEVLTDTDCVPDEEMISRCRNEVLLPDGGTIVLRHPHDMTRVPCLAPGEQVRLVPATF
ncbi:MAG TPA: hypothetical protein VM184_10915 [Gaiellaceae bacterium]|nr:hypothetical protein [Gaiellaceae bacterium]